MESCSCSANEPVVALILVVVLMQLKLQKHLVIMPEPLTHQNSLIFIVDLEIFTTSSDVKRIDYTSSGNAFGFGTDDFTIEWWMYATANADGNHYVWDTTGQKSSLIRKSGGGMTFETLGSSGAIGEVTILSSGSYNLNKWAYWAVVRDGDNVRVYIDGVLIQTTTGFSGVDFGDADGDIGGYHGGSAVYNADAYIQDFRIYKGIAKYTGTSVDTQYVTVPSKIPRCSPRYSIRSDWF